MSPTASRIASPALPPGPGLDSLAGGALEEAPAEGLALGVVGLPPKRTAISSTNATATRATMSGRLDRLWVSMVTLGYLPHEADLGRCAALDLASIAHRSQLRAQHR